MTSLESDQICSFLEALGERYLFPAQLYLLGGSALCLLGSPRPTLDIDYMGDDLNKDDLQKLMEQIAHEMGLEVEAVAIDHFVPITSDGLKRSLHFGTYGKIETFILDPYSIALSKIDRGFDTDLDDVVFLIRRGLVDLDELERLTQELLLRAGEFDIYPKEMLAHLREVHERL
jgi:hypothetical protein